MLFLCYFPMNTTTILRLLVLENLFRCSHVTYKLLTSIHAMNSAEIGLLKIARLNDKIVSDSYDNLFSYLFQNLENELGTGASK